MGAIQPWHWLLVLLVILLLFGSRKLPDAARGLGRSMRIFKSEMKEMQADGQDASGSTSQRPELTQAQPQASAYPTGAVAGNVPPQHAAAPVDGRPPAPQPIWDPNTQQYVLPNQQPPAGGTPPQTPQQY